MKDSQTTFVATINGVPMCRHKGQLWSIAKLRASGVTKPQIRQLFGNSNLVEWRNVDAGNQGDHDEPK